MPKCQFSTKYYDYEVRNSVDFNCQELSLLSGFCIFHDKDYLQDRTNYEEHKRKVLDRLKHKINHSISNNEPLLCIGFQLPEFSLSDLSINKEFTKPVYFSDSQFFGKVNFSEANFKGEANFLEANFKGEADFVQANFEAGASFSRAKFQGEAKFSEANFPRDANFANFDKANFHREARFSRANFQRIAQFSLDKFQGGANFFNANFLKVYFSRAKFQGDAYFNHANFQGGADFSRANFQGPAYFSGEFNDETKFNYVLFEGKEKVIFDIENLSNVSFMNSDVTGVRFSDEARWGGGDTKEDKFKIVDERLLEKEIEDKGGYTVNFNLGSIKAVYRSLRENYEYRMRYDEAGQFFIREMELKRKYREVPSKEEDSPEIKQNNWFRRNLFSLTGWYYHLSRYGESLWRPTLTGLAIIILSTLFWSTQENPELKPWLPIFQDDDDTGNVTKFVGFDKFGDGDHWLKAYERSIAGFIPLLPLESGIKVGIIDYVIKIVGGAVVFALIAVALRRRFERRYRH